MKVTVIGAGYVGLTGGAVLADHGHTVWVVRRDREKIENLKKGIIPIYEPGLPAVVRRNVKTGRLIPTTAYAEGVPQSEVVFIAVGTPQNEKDGAADLTQVFAAAREVAKHLREGFTVVVDKSTVPPGTAERVEKIINKYKRGPRVKFAVVSSPEFLREGKALEDTVHPDRIVIGSASPPATKIMVALHKKFKCPLVVTSVRSAEVIKYAANAYLSLRIGFIDQIANLCEKMGADVMDVIGGIGLDRRIGTHYWFPGMGYGGYCFPKDVKALAALFVKVGEKDNLFIKLDRLNEARVARYVTRLRKALGSLRGKRIGVLGLAAKPGTDDIRGSVALHFVKALKKLGAKIKVYDPLAQENARLVLQKTVTYCRNPYQVIKGTAALVVMVEDEEFKKLKMEKVKKLMKKPLIFDVKNIYNLARLRRFGFTVHATGR